MFAYFERFYLEGMAAREILADILLPLFLSAAMWKFCLKRKNIIRASLLFLVVYAANILMRMFGWLLLGFLDDWLRVFLLFYISSALCATVAAALFHDYRVTTRIIWGSILLITWYLSPSISYFLGVGDGGGFVMTLPRMFIMAALVVVLKRWNIDNFHFAGVWHIAVFALVCGLTCVIQIILGLNPQLTGVSSYINLLNWVIVVIVYFLYYNFIKAINVKAIIDIENQKLKGEMVLMGFMKENYDSIRMLKHDVKNQYSYIAMLYEQGKDSEAKEYFRLLCNNAADVLNVVSTGNQVVDLTISLAQAKAARAGVKFNPVCTVPRDMRFNDSDLFSLLINIIDNAIEGGERSEAEEKTVSLYICANDGYLMIWASNPVEPSLTMEKLKERRTSKFNKEAHGYGQSIIAKIAAKYNGEAAYEIKDGLFYSRVMLALLDASELTCKER